MSHSARWCFEIPPGVLNRNPTGKCPRGVTQCAVTTTWPFTYRSVSGSQTAATFSIAFVSLSCSRIVSSITSRPRLGFEKPACSRTSRTNRRITRSGDHGASPRKRRFVLACRCPVKRSLRACTEKRDETISPITYSAKCWNWSDRRKQSRKRSSSSAHIGGIPTTGHIVVSCSVEAAMVAALLPLYVPQAQIPATCASPAGSVLPHPGAARQLAAHALRAGGAPGAPDEPRRGLPHVAGAVQDPLVPADARGVRAQQPARLRPAVPRLRRPAAAVHAMSAIGHPLRSRLARGPLLCDGAMGTLLYARGIPYDQCFDALNLTQREVVLGVHLDYLRAGAEMIETNTFGANPIKLGAHGLADRVRDVNWHGAKIAKEARDIFGQAVFIAGSVGPLGKPLAPFGRITPAEARAAFRSQIDALVEGGADVLILETFADLTELGEAVRAARECCDLPLVAQMSFTEDGRTQYGHAPAEVVEALEAAGVDVVGANCSVGPVPMLEVVQQMAAAAHVPVSAQPNAGFPTFVEGRYLYPSSPAHMATYARKMVEAGAGIVGGCCGTTPEHIAAIGRAIADLRPAPARVEPVAPPPPREERVPPVDQPSALAQKLARQFVISVEVDPPKGLDATKDL